MIKEIYELDYEKGFIDSAILEMNKSFHKDLTSLLKIYREIEGINAIDNVERKSIEHYFYYYYLNGIHNDKYNRLKQVLDFHFDRGEKIELELKKGIEYLNDRIKDSKKEKSYIMNSLVSRVKNADDSNYFSKIADKYCKYIEKKELDNQQLFVLNLKASGSKENDLKIAISFLEDIYVKLVNYHYAAIIFENIDDKKTTWDTIAKTAIFAENFKSSDKFPPFIRNREKQKEKLFSFLKQNKFLDIEDDNINNIVLNFYEKQSYGFMFSDLLISKDLNKKILILQKVEYDDENILCPDCLDNDPRGNSYDKVLFKSFECNNSYCISRSKSGRGKRYNYLSAKINTKMHFITEDDKISYDLYKHFRRDIYDSNLNELEMLIKFYSFAGDKIGVYVNNEVANELNKFNKFNRNVEYFNIDIEDSLDVNNKINSLPIVDLLNSVKQYIKDPKELIEIKDRTAIINDDSTDVLYKLKTGSFTHAITSPPYYNARDYSQWTTLLTYIIDMFINAYYINSKIDKDGVYLYNIGDIVDQDNIYIPSTMSKRKQIIGLYSAIIFEKAGWYNNGNIIWDKGEVQSKRNSTSNLSPYYVKPINCYEYVWIFSKKNNKNYYEAIEKINPVIKINSLGINKAKHSAPYPLDIVNLIRGYLSQDSILLDPFLGSGTTALWCRQNDYGCIGIEINKDYYNLCIDKLNL